MRFRLPTLKTTVLLAAFVMGTAGSGVWVATTPSYWLRGAILLAWVCGYSSSAVLLPRLDGVRGREQIGGVAGFAFTAICLALPHRYAILMLAWAGTMSLAALVRDRKTGRLWRAR